MNIFNFDFYNKDAELIDGDYWKFLDATPEMLINENIYLYRISDIIQQINNAELKMLMRNKIIDLIMEKGIFFNGLEQNIDMFSDEELKVFLEAEYKTNIINYLSDHQNIPYKFPKILNFIRFLKNVNDIKWEYNMITTILDIVKNYQDKTALVNIIEYNKYNPELYNNLINQYYNYFPDEYKNYLKMKQDPNYIHKKCLHFMKDDIELDIGIDPKISIGTEIEANNDYETIQFPLAEQNGFENFYTFGDATVPDGIEVIARKPFHNTKEDLVKFCGLCEAMKDIGYYYSEISQNASGQINLGLDYLDTKEAILNFYEIYANCEELLYYICNDDGQLFRQDVYVNSRIKPLSEIIGKRFVDEEASREDIIKLFNVRTDYNDNAIKKLQYKKNSVCLRGTSERDYRLEFRIPNGGCNYRTWINNIRLFGKMLEIAKKLADITKKDEFSLEDQVLLNYKIELQNINLSHEEKLSILMNLLFKDDNIKQIYYDRYVNTIKKIEKTKSNKYNKSNNPYEPGFGEVEFIDEYHSRIDYGDDGITIAYDPDLGIIEPNKRK